MKLNLMSMETTHDTNLWHCARKQKSWIYMCGSRLKGLLNLVIGMDFPKGTDNGETLGVR